MCQYGVVVRWFGSNSLWIEPTGFDPRWERSLFFLFDDSFQMNESSFTHKENLKSETVGTIRSLPTLISKKRMALVWTTLKKYIRWYLKHDLWNRGHRTSNIRVRMFDDVRYFLNIEMFDVRMFANIQMFESSNVRMFANIWMFKCSMFECSLIFDFSKVRMFACSLVFEYSNVRCSNVR